MQVTLMFSELSFAQSENDTNAGNREFTYQGYAIGGKKSTFCVFYRIQIDCSPVAWSDVTITKSPENGEAKLTDTSTIINFNAPNPRAKCNGKTTKALALEYTPKKGYTGMELIEVESLGSSGFLSKYTYNITVVK
jgi:hypothetical protein